MKKFLKSEDYYNFFRVSATENIMNCAYLCTENYKFRHHEKENVKKLGVWRWRGMYEYKDLIIDIIFNKKKIGVDLGGAYAPITKQSIVVDIENKDANGKKVLHKNLKNLTDLDYVFSSHCLEHIPNLFDTIKDIHNSLKIGGKLILNLPSFSHQGWWAREWYLHLFTFCLTSDYETNKHRIPNLVDIQSEIEKYFKINVCHYCGDNSIFILAEKIQ